METKQFEWGKDPIENYLAVYDWHWTENCPEYADYLPRLREIVYAAIAEDVRWMEEEEQEAWFAKYTEEGRDRSFAVIAVAKDILGIEELFDDAIQSTLSPKDAAIMLLEDVVRWHRLAWYLPKNKDGDEPTYEEYYSAMGLRVPNDVDVPTDMLEAIGRWYPYANLCLMLFTAGKLYEAIQARQDEITKNVQLHSGGLENIMDVVVSPERSKEEGLSLEARKVIRELVYASSHFWSPVKVEDIGPHPRILSMMLTARREILTNISPVKLAPGT